MFKTDDDIFLNIPLLHKKAVKASENDETRNILMGKILHEHKRRIVSCNYYLWLPHVKFYFKKSICIATFLFILYQYRHHSSILVSGKMVKWGIHENWKCHPTCIMETYILTFWMEMDICYRETLLHAYMKKEWNFHT